MARAMAPKTAPIEERPINTKDSELERLTTAFRLSGKDALSWANTITPDERRHLNFPASQEDFDAYCARHYAYRNRLH